MRARVLAVVLAACASVQPGCSNTGRNTQVIVTTDAERSVRAMANTLIVRVYRGRLGEMVPSTVVFERPFDVSQDTGSWPRVVALAPMTRGDVMSIYRFEAAAYREGSPTSESVPVATVRLISGYSRDQTLHVRLVLQDACIGIVCGLDETCDRGGCITATVDPTGLGDAGLPVDRMDAGTPMDGGPPDGGPVCTAAMCDDGLACTTDFCMPDGTCDHPIDTSFSCDDSNECTMDACIGAGGDADGCEHVARTGEPCANDMDFCTGVETCSAAGMCESSGDPCIAPTTCSGGMCVGCTRDDMCPLPITTPGSCGFADACVETGSADDVVTTFRCMGGSCLGTDATVPRTCNRETDTLVCGATTFTMWSACGDFGSTCDETGTQSRTRISRTCAAGVCTPMGDPETQTCMRDTSMFGCDDGDGCTGPDRCVAGACAPGPSTCGDAGGPICSGPGDCDDFRQCTEDQCVGGGTFCQHLPMDSLCPTPFLPCVVSLCQPANPMSDPGTGCVDDYSGCDAGMPECSTDPDCEDGDVCTVDVCNTGGAFPVCEHFPSCVDSGSPPVDSSTGRDGGRPTDSGGVITFDGGGL